ncbi:MAG: hypothetical protein DMF89_06950 [Acidobacteria bacterium]|nr:MAG: hypothetical protein DMF89_06950 [Acidobacteriota bacterium]
MTKLTVRNGAGIAAGLLVGAMLVVSGSAGRERATTSPPDDAPGRTHAESGRVTAEGRIATYPAGDVLLGTSAAGVVSRVPVEERMRVRTGDLLAELRAFDLEADMAEARARIVEADADLRFFDLEVERTAQLLQLKMGSRQEHDRNVRNRDTAHARRAVADAQLRRLTALLQNTRIVSPMDGFVVGRYVDPGEAVSAGTAMIRVADLARMRVEAEVDEFDAGRIEVGAAATLRAEGYSDRSWPGRVEEIPDVLVERRLKPKDPGRFSDTRVLLVKIALLDHVPLRLGERVEVEIAGALEGETARPEAGRP